MTRHSMPAWRQRDSTVWAIPRGASTTTAAGGNIAGIILVSRDV